MRSHRAQRRSGFTLVELLTVVGIIALLIGILVPAVQRARMQAKKGTVQAQIKAISDGLEMFRNDFNKYPESAVKVRNASGTWIDKLDPITGYPNIFPTPPDDSKPLTGAHWLARALVGPDLQGIDPSGLTLRDRTEVTLNTATPPMLVTASGGAGTGATLTQFQTGQTERKAPYIENSNKLIRRDDDTVLGQTGAPKNGRPLFVDTFGSPVLYYRANPRAPRAFTAGVADTNGGSGVYNWEDNARITGQTGPTDTDDNAMDTTAWSFLEGVSNHAIARFGANPYAQADLEKRHTFINFIHDHNVDSMMGSTTAVVPPRVAMNPDTFILMTAGPDGRFGTDDDVANFKLGGL